MKLVILGASGRTGQLVLKAALDKGMDVTAVVRSAEKTPTFSHERLKVVVGDPCDAAFLKQTLRGQDAVISALGGRSPTKSATSIYYRSADALVDAAWDNGLKRVLVTSTALLFQDQTLMGRFLRWIVPNVVSSAKRMEDTLKASGLNWTSARPGFLNDADVTSYRAQEGGLPENGTSISRQALARFLIDALDNPEAARAAFGVSSTAA